jgi:hypothetical protein
VPLARTFGSPLAIYQTVSLGTWVNKGKKKKKKKKKKRRRKDRGY